VVYRSILREVEKKQRLAIKIRKSTYLPQAKNIKNDILLNQSIFSQ
jgi:hypothetical protein